MNGWGIRCDLLIIANIGLREKRCGGWLWTNIFAAEAKLQGYSTSPSLRGGEVEQEET
jgi:hypothetical protein